MNFAKLHGAGNDYIVIDARNKEADWPALARRMCHRHFGVGADGLILGLDSSRADLRMRMFNPDGSEAEMCGNGIRCLARFALDRGMVAPKEGGLTVETLAGTRVLTPIYAQGRMVAARVNMGRPILKPREIPLSLEAEGPLVDYPVTLEGRELYITCLSMGNPHAVAFVEEDVASFPLDRLGPLMEHHPLFPKRVNFEVVNVMAPHHLRARVWERGAGETLACSTGACAIVVAACIKGVGSSPVKLHYPGGTLEVEWDGEGEVFLSGPVEEVFEGEWRL